jgi:hypothetical protein
MHIVVQHPDNDRQVRLIEHDSGHILAEGYLVVDAAGGVSFQSLENLQAAGQLEEPPGE